MLYVPRSSNGIDALMRWAALEEEAAKRMDRKLEWAVQANRELGNAKEVARLMGRPEVYKNPFSEGVEGDIRAVEDQKVGLYDQTGGRMSALSSDIKNIAGQIKDAGRLSEREAFLASLPQKEVEEINQANSVGGFDKSYLKGKYGDKSKYVSGDQIDYSSLIKKIDDIAATNKKNEELTKKMDELRAQQVSTGGLTARESFFAGLKKEDVDEINYINRTFGKDAKSMFDGWAKDKYGEKGMLAFGAPVNQDSIITKMKEIQSSDARNAEIADRVGQMRRYAEKDLRGNTAGEMQDDLIRRTYDAVRRAKDPTAAYEAYVRGKSRYNDIGTSYYRKDFPEFSYFMGPTGGGGGGKPDNYMVVYADGSQEKIRAGINVDTSTPDWVDKNRKRLGLKSTEEIVDVVPMSLESMSSYDENVRAAEKRAVVMKNMELADAQKNFDAARKDANVYMSAAERAAWERANPFFRLVGDTVVWKDSYAPRGSSNVAGQGESAARKKFGVPGR